MLPTFLTPPRSKSISTRTARALAFLVALIVLCVSLSAEAKKKKHKKGKTPAASSKSKKSSTEAAPSDSDESDEGSDEESSSSAKKAPAEEEEAKPPKPAASEGEESPEPPAKKPAKAKPPKEEEASAGGGGGLPALQLGLGGKALFRTLSWTDSGGRLAPYSISPGPEVGLWLEAYPAAFATDGFAANIGLFGRFDYGIGAESKLMDGTKLTTKYQDFYGGLKVRIPLGMATPYAAGAYGAQKFELTPIDPGNSRPNFNYSFIRAGAGARLQFTPMVDADVAVNYLIVLGAGSGAGEVKTLYPSSTANGIDATLSFGVRLMSMVGLRAGVDFRQYGVALHWRSGNPGVQAGGATDRYIAAWGGIEIFFDGVGGGAGGEEEAPKAPAKAKKAPPPSEDGDEAPAKNTDKDEKASDVE